MQPVTARNTLLTEYDVSSILNLICPSCGGPLGAMLLFGAIATFILAAIGRKRLSGQRPEQYLTVWQKKAESRMSNPLAYLGRHLEFIIRRCFLPYALLMFGVLNLIWVPICVGAIGANLAWIISAYSLVAFSPRQGKPEALSANRPAASKPLTA